MIAPQSRHEDWLSPEQVASLTLPVVVERVIEAGPLLTAEAPLTEQQRRPTEAAWSALRKTGLFYLYVPRTFGGMGAQSFSAMVDVVPHIAEQCASTAWCAVQCLMHQWLVGLFPPAFQKEIWGALPYLTAAGSAYPPGKAERVDGGYRMSGRFRWGTGVMYAQWVFGFALVEAPGEKPQARCFFIPVDEVTVFDTWNTDGMAGTASHDYEVRDTFVPEHRTLGVAALQGVALADDAEPNRVPLSLVTTLAASLPILGAARAAVKAYRARLSGSGPDGGPSERGLDHVRLGKADLSVAMAERSIRDAVSRTEQLATERFPPTELEQGEIRAQFAFSVGLCREAIRAISDASGSSAHALSHPLQRAVRDVNMLSTHAGVELETSLETLGRLQLGLPPARKTVLQSA